MDTSLREGLIIGIGNPLLDISANVGDDMLEKYGLKANDAIMAEEKHMPIYQELMEQYNAEFIAGGSVQNTLRVAQWIIKKPQVCTYFGCVGDDDYAKILRERATADGVTIHYQVTKEAPTGTCAVLVTHTKRSLCANLAAAQKFTPDHLAKPECQRSIEAAKYFYSSGFFIAVSPESMLQLAMHAHEHGHQFLINLSAPFVSQFYKEPLEKIMQYVDILFGNEMEAEAFAKAFNMTGSLQDIAVQMSKLPQDNPDVPRTVVITQGPDPVILVENGKVTLVPVPPLAVEEMVDTNGAGDAFTGGFLGQLVQGKSYKTCIECGIFAARHVIKHSGCTFTGECDFEAGS